MKRLLIVCAVEKEAEAVGEHDHCTVVVSGIGRTNAAVATTEAILTRGPFDAVLSMGVAGALPGTDLEIGDMVVARACVYAEEGLLTPGGFHDVESLGFSLGDFAGNCVPVDPHLLDRLSKAGYTALIATVATVSGTDEAAAEIRRRTNAVAEAMEGAAVVHAARRLNTPAIEVRVISNTTGARDRQQWDFASAMKRLRQSAGEVIERLKSG